MKRVVFHLLMALLILTSFGFDFVRNPESGIPDIKGTWKLESFRYGNSSNAFAIASESSPHLKLIADNSFQWASYNASTKKITRSAGGTYILDGDSYTEMVEYGYNMELYVGTRSTFKIKIEDDMLFISGKLSTGYPIEEIWQRVK